MTTIAIVKACTTTKIHRRTMTPCIMCGYVLLVRFGLGLLLLASALPKLQRPYDFLATVYGYETLSPAAGELVAIAVPWTELALAVCLLSGAVLPGAFLLTALLGVVFVAAQLTAMAKGLHIDCGCFASGSGSDALGSSGGIGPATLLRAAAVAIAAMAGCAAMLWIARKKKTSQCAPSFTITKTR